MEELATFAGFWNFGFSESYVRKVPNPTLELSSV
jgi:hypothetical protein